MGAGVLSWCLLHHTEPLELQSALLHSGQPRPRNSYSSSIAIEPAAENGCPSLLQSHTPDRGSSWVRTRMLKAISRPPEMFRVMQLLGARSLFLAHHSKGPLGLGSVNKGAKGLGGASPGLLASL